MATVKVVLEVPEYKHCTTDQIIEFCKANNEVEWLKATVKANTKGFFALRKSFYLKFAPDQIPVAKKSFADKIAAL